jgi:hypothetical protein
MTHLKSREEARSLRASALLTDVLSVTCNRVSKSEVACPHIATHDRAAPALVIVACSSCVVRLPGEERVASVAAPLMQRSSDAPAASSPH